MKIKEELAWFTLARTRGIGPKKLWAVADFLMSKDKTASWLLSSEDELRATLGNNIISSDALPLIDNLSAELDKLTEDGIKFIHPFHIDFPERLRVLKNHFPLPAVIFAKGNLSLFNAPSVAIIGSRNAGQQALEVADNLSGELAKKGINIVSGYAKGIDITAHIGTLRRSGSTTIVMAEGIHGFHIKREMSDYVSDDNILVVSQFEPHAKWAGHNAMTRNKLTCALSSAVIVVVSGPARDANNRMSGSFDTALTAISMKIPTFVLASDYLDDNPEGNKVLSEKGCKVWVPSDGIKNITDSVFSEPTEEDIKVVQESAKLKKSKTAQLDLFGRVK